MDGGRRSCLFRCRFINQVFPRRLRSWDAGGGTLDTERELDTDVDVASDLDELGELDGLLGGVLEVVDGENLEAGFVDL